MARSGISAAFAELSDDQSENTHRAIARLSREAATYLALSAANVASRSDWQLGREGLARKKGYPSAEDYVLSLGGGGGSTKADTRRLIEAGTMATEAETARTRQEQADQLARKFPEQPPVSVLVVGREQRLFTAAQRAALALRDGGCRWPDCHRPPSYTEAHHLHGWNNGGLTNLDDGILLCARDHLRLHNGGWEITRTGMGYWLIPPPATEPTRTPIRLASASPMKPQSPLRSHA